MGENMAQLYDMHLAGAVGFGDYKKPFKNANLMRISLDYVQSFDGLILSYPLDSSLSKNGLMNEGETSVSLGLKGIPEVAENSILSRDIQLLEYTKGKLHFPFISSAKGLEIIKEARNKGLNISCGVSLPHLMFTDKYLIDFDTNFKLNPPLRSDHDRQALRQGLLEGTVDLVSSMHEPMNIEYKELEFTSAHSGTIGLESSFGILNTIFTLEKVISFLTKGRDLFNISNNKIKIGEKANLSLFNPNINYTLESQYLFSKSKNCAFLGMPLNGKVYGCVNNDNMTLNED
jgi:dihydroorotase